MTPSVEVRFCARFRPGWVRWWKFNAVGAIGIVVQLVASIFFYRVVRLGLAWSPALAVECAVLHNFVWHERWTWRDRAQSGSPAVRLLRFNLSAGLISIACNVAGTPFLVGVLGIQYVVANLVCIAAGAVANFFAAAWFAFRSSPGFYIKIQAKPCANGAATGKECSDGRRAATKAFDEDAPGRYLESGGYGASSQERYRTVPLQRRAEPGGSLEG